MRQTVTATGLSAWASYLINGDDSGIDAEDKRAANEFAQSLGGPIVDCEDAGFMWRPDSFQFMPLGGDCQRYTALVESAQ
jgi:hypothetical protein